MESMSTARSNQILALLATAALMGVLDFSIVNVALPSNQEIRFIWGQMKRISWFVS